MPMTAIAKMLDVIPDACLLVEGIGRIAAANVEAHHLFGWPAGALVGKDVEVLLDPADRAGHGAHMGRFVARPERRSMGTWRAVRAARRDGTRFFADIALNPVGDAERPLTTVSVRDVSELVAARVRAEDTQRQIEALLDLARIGTWSLDLRTRTRTYSAALLQMIRSGQPHETDDAFASALHPDDAPRVHEATARCIADGTPYRLHVRLRLPDGSWGAFATLAGLQRDLDGAPIAVSGFVRDYTAEQQAHDQIILADRLNHVGMLAATVVHEVNNPLGALLLNLDVAGQQLRRLTESSVPLIPVAALHDIAAATADARTSTEVVVQRMRDLRALGRGEGAPPELVDLTATVGSNLRLVRRRIEERARLVTLLAPTRRVRGSSARVGQLALNLLLNAVSAVPDGASTRHEVRVETADVGDRVALTVTDTGHGMTPDVVSRLFTPFFTTRHGAGGTGLGLFVCHQIVTAMGGTIEVESQVGAGTRIRVLLPSEG